MWCRWRCCVGAECEEPASFQEYVGVLLYWKRGQSGYFCHEHNTHEVISLKKITTTPLDDLAMIYVYFYVFPRFELEIPTKVLPPEGYDDPELMHDPYSPMSQGTAASDVTMSATSPTTTTSEAPAVVLGPEA